MARQGNPNNSCLSSHGSGGRTSETKLVHSEARSEERSRPVHLLVVPRAPQLKDTSAQPLSLSRDFRGPVLQISLSFPRTLVVGCWAPPKSRMISFQHP